MKEFNFGFGQVKVKFEGKYLWYKTPGRGWAFTALKDITSISTKQGAAHFHIVLMAGGAKLTTLRVPNKFKSQLMAQEVIEYFEVIK